jgi:hypothetical protein
MSSVEVPKMRYAKPEGFKGRGHSKSYKFNKWKITMYDKETGEMRSGKYPTKEKLIEDFKLDIGPDHIYRLATGHKVDTNKSKKNSSFLSRYGHIKIEKINEPSIQNL